MTKKEIIDNTIMELITKKNCKSVFISIRTEDDEKREYQCKQDPRNFVHSKDIKND
jgi:hypothetical protein